MESFENIVKRLFGVETRKPQKTMSPQDKRVVIKHNGRQTVYRINKYGEIFEQK